MSTTQCAGAMAPLRRPGTPDIRSIPSAAAISQGRQRRSWPHRIRLSCVGSVGGRLRVPAIRWLGLIVVPDLRVW